MKLKLNTLQFLALGYLTTILAGSILLCMPISSKSGEFTNFFNSLFTATSATCVTGLVVYDTFAHWSIFGQVVILILIQLGGLGFMTVITLIFMLFKRKIGLFERVVLMQSAGSYNLSGIIKLIKKIVIGTFIFETTGMILLATRFIPLLGVGKGIYYALFHSVSAFCNAGFDLMGCMEQFSSLTYFYSDPVVSLTITGLIIIGGIGFIVWSDLWQTRFRFKKFQLHTKIVVVYNGFLIIFGMLLYLVFEYNNAFSGMTFGQKLLCSFFQSVTPRTAGFNTCDITKLSESGSLLTVILMFIGGNPGSTAGGVKVTTVVIVFSNLLTSAKNGDETNIFNRRVSAKLIKQASSLFLVYLSAIILSTILILAVEPYTIKQVLFEVTSAIGTVGLSYGITPHLTYASKTIIIFLMFAGRMGAFSLFSVFFSGTEKERLVKPEGKVLIG